jgi:hypothetical protein
VKMSVKARKGGVQSEQMAASPLRTKKARISMAEEAMLADAIERWQLRSIEARW